MWTKFKRTTVFFRASVPYRCRTFQIETAINYKRENIWLKLFFNLKCTQVISDYFIHSFVAVFIVADIFMCSIDAITSKTKVYIVFSSYSVASLKWKKILFILQEITVSGPDGTQEKIEVPIWNGTAANIILMSLGPRYFLWLHLSFVYCIVYFISCVIALQPIS